MSSEMSEITESINKIARFLALRNIAALSREELSKHYQLEQAEQLILLGNSILYTAELAAEALNSGLAKQLMIVGGVGHSTVHLRENVRNSSRYQDIEVEGKAEADILSDIILRITDIPVQDILLETASTNCGNNATYALQMINNLNKEPRSIILLQDPTMQLRTMASFRKAWERTEERVSFIHFAPFIPQVKVQGDDLVFDGLESFGAIWSMERFLSLIMGEIPRLRDDQNGYGPNGRGFITHVDIPESVLSAYDRLLERYGGNVRSMMN